MNNVTLMGRIGQDAEVVSVGEMFVIKLSVATSRKYKNKQGELIEDTQWHNIEYWSKSDAIAQYLLKGKGVGVVGELIYDKWQDKEGNNRITAKVKAQRVDFAPSDSSGAQQQQQKPQSRPRPQAQAVGPDDLPF